MPHVLGLDAALIALLWQEIGARSLGVSLPWPMRLILFGTVWGIYLLDRVWDVRRLPVSQLPSLRHQWARKCPIFFIILSFLSLLMAGVLSLVWLPSRLLIGGMVIAGCCGIYYWLHAASRKQGASLWRALLLGFLFVAGSWWAPLMISGKAWTLEILLLIPPWLLFSSNALACMRAEDLSRAGRFAPRAVTMEKMSGLLIGITLVVAASCGVISGHWDTLGTACALLLILPWMGRIGGDSFCALCDAALLVPVLWILF